MDALTPARALATRLPVELAPLAALAHDLWWTWHPEAAALFRDVDPLAWDASPNPVVVLREASPTRLDAASRDASLVARVRAVAEARARELTRPGPLTGIATPERPIAFFCAEFGVHASLPIYSGGLGVLAGDILKQASDDGLAMVGVGLFYRRGYFRQRLDTSGWQHEYWTATTPAELPMAPVLDDRGEPRAVRVALRGRDVAVRIWRVDVGRVPLFLLDTDLPDNDPVSRFITSTLYIGDRAFRLMQYAVLAIGGVRALDAMGIAPATFHLNEGHASLAALELARQERARGATFEGALAAARERIVFTTHTPVAAGNERYGDAEMTAVLGGLPSDLGVTANEIFALGRGKPDDTEFDVTALALRTSRAANGVSRRHGEVARGMWQHLWPGRDARDVPIGHVTNGVHVPTWMSPPMRALLDRHLGGGWLSSGDPAVFDRVDAIPDEELWAVRCALRARLVDYVRNKSIADRLARGEPIAYAEGAARTFDPDVLTVGFARRVASYKRLYLVIRDPPRALALLHGPHAMQVVMAGRAHPKDDGAKELVKAIFALKHTEAAGTRVAFIEDYDLAVASELVAGCDLWVNLPRPPLEASGTSGMKAALNGGLNLSVLDGWWCEAFDEGVTGWAIASASERDAETQDARDAETFYGLAEREVVPAFYERDARGIPRAWVKRIKGSLRKVVAHFSARRMLGEYAARTYRAGSAPGG